MATIDQLKNKQSILYIKMKERKDRYEFFSNFLISCDLSNEDLLSLVKHQIKSDKYHIECLYALLTTITSDRKRMNYFSKSHPELYPRNSREIYFKMHEAYKEEYAKKRDAYWNEWTEQREKILKDSEDDDLKLEDGLSEENEL